MLESEVAETLMSLSAPDERKFASPLYARGGLPWHRAGPSAASSGSSGGQADAAGAACGSSKKRSFNAFDTAQTLASSLPTVSFLPPPMSELQRKVHERPLTSLLPRAHRHRGDEDDDDDDDDDSDVDMDDSSSPDEDDGWKAASGHRYRSPFDGLVAAARDQEEGWSASGGSMNTHSSSSSSSQPIMIPRAASGSGRFHGEYLSGSLGKKHKWGSGGSSLGRVREDGAYLSASAGSAATHDSSPTGVEDDEEGPGAWFDPEYSQRMRLASICSSEAGSEYGGLGRQHLEEFIRMEISAANENDPPANGLGHGHSQPLSLSLSPSEGGRFIGSYSPEARRKRIERFLEKRKRRVWAKKVDYDVRKNFANSRLRVKGRFVKKEDEELLCHLLSFT